MPESVVLISAVDPFPTDAGKKVVLAGFLQYFVERFGRQNVHYLMVGGRDQVGFPAELHPLPKPRVAAALGSVVTRTAAGRASLQESLLHSNEVRRAIAAALDQISPTLEVYDTVRMAQYAPIERADQQICYLDDLFSERYRAMLIATERYPDVDIRPVGNFATHVPAAFRPIADNPHGQRLLLRTEQRLVRRSEDKAAHRFRTSLLVNAREAAVLQQRTGVAARRVLAIPPLVRRATSIERNYGGAPEFVFIGLLSLPHNDDGLRSFLADVWPRVLAMRSDAHLRVVGKFPRPALSALVTRYASSVTFEGFVPDLSELLSRTAALINPLRFGSGIKLKVVDALGAGIPVVSTSVGADSIATGPDAGVLVADDPAELATLLMDVTDREVNARLSAAARQHFSERYSPEAVFDCYDAAFARNTPGVVLGD